jgi:hypothetical protein
MFIPVAEPALTRRKDLSLWNLMQSSGEAERTCFIVVV